MADMYDWDKVLREDKSRTTTKNPSFSSSLLDEIYRSIDGSDESFGEFKLRRPKMSKKQTGGDNTTTATGRGRFKSTSAVEDEEIASFRRACLVDKWMEMKGNKKAAKASKRPTSLPEFDRKSILDNDPMFFSSGSSSSDSSFGWYSEAETAAKPKPSCFGPFNKVKTSVSPRSSVKKQQNEFNLFDENQTNKTDHSGLIRSKTRALKIYSSLKKVKQPISPGGRLTNFLNALFPNGHSKKSKDTTGVEDRTKTSKSTNVSTCSSASSFSRSCLSKNSPRSREQLNNGMRRTVRFYPASVNMDQDSHTCSRKNIWAKQDFEKMQLPRIENLISTRQIDDEEEDDDMASDTSSDLFELDHLSIFKNKQYCEELPVYETTHLSTNRAIASGLVC